MISYKERCLAPILFIIYIKDVKLTSNGKLTWAADTVLLVSAISRYEVFNNTENQFNKVKSWVDHNLLSLNIDR